MKLQWGLRTKFPRTFIVLEKDAIGGGYHLAGHPDKPWIVEDPRKDLVFLGAA